MFRSRWLPLLLVVAAIACDQTLPSAPSLGGLRRSSIPSVSASDQSADLQVSGEDQVLYESTNLPDYPNTLIADVTISGAVHFDGDPNQGPYFQASGDIGAAGFLVNQTCTLRTTITFRIGGLGSQGACPTAATGDQTLQQTMLINGSGRLELQPSASTRNFCGFTTICWTYSGAMHVKVHPRSAALKLTVDNENPDSGTTVTATVTTNPDKIAGIAVPINGDVEWDLPDPGVHCNGGNRVCTFTATQSGTLLVTGIVNGATSSDEVEINVQPKPDSMPHDSTSDSTGACLGALALGETGRLQHSASARSSPQRGSCETGHSANLTCLDSRGSASITRGDTVFCEVRVQPSAGFTVTRWRSAGADGFGDTISNAETVARGGSARWSGPAVLSSSVFVAVTVGAGSTVEALNASAQFNVIPREWHLDYRTRPESVFVNGPPLLYPPYRPPSLSLDSALGISGIWAADKVAYPLPKGVSEGPNAFWLYVSAPLPPASPTAWISSGFLHNDPWFLRQGPPRRSGESRFPCTSFDLDTIKAHVLKHEGVIPGLFSHYDAYSQYLTQHDVNQQIEGLTRFALAVSADSMNSLIVSTYDAWQSGVDSAQAPVDVDRINVTCGLRP